MSAKTYMTFLKLQPESLSAWRGQLSPVGEKGMVLTRMLYPMTRHYEVGKRPWGLA